MPDPAARAANTEILLEGDLPSPAGPPAGCRFHTRCWLARQLVVGGEPAAADVPDVPVRCSAESPALTATTAAGHPDTGHRAAEQRAACHYAVRTAITKTGSPR